MVSRRFVKRQKFVRKKKGCRFKEGQPFSRKEANRLIDQTGFMLF